MKEKRIFFCYDAEEHNKVQKILYKTVQEKRALRWICRRSLLGFRGVPESYIQEHPMLQETLRTGYIPTDMMYDDIKLEKLTEVSQEILG